MQISYWKAGGGGGFCTFISAKTNMVNMRVKTGWKKKPEYAANDIGLHCGILQLSFILTP